MILFLIKSSVSLFILLGVYHFLLSKERMYQFNRFYLLLSIVFSFSLPFIPIQFTTTKYIEGPFLEKVVSTYTIPNTPTSIVNFEPNKNVIANIKEDQPTIGLKQLSIVAYLIIAFICLCRLFIIFFRLYKKSSSNKQVIHEHAIVVLVPEKTLPYTFLNKIFINEDDYRSGAIEEELFTHELTHVNQRHTLDILLIEFLQAVFWFNPLIYLYKKQIQLNHEYLADQKVLEKHQAIHSYQELLFTKIIQNKMPHLSSNFNYISTKKRLKMMTKQTSTLRSLSLVSLVLCITIGLSSFLGKSALAQKNNDMNKKKLEWGKGELKKPHFVYQRIGDIEGAVDDISFHSLSKEQIKALPPVPSNFKLNWWSTSDSTQQAYFPLNHGNLLSVYFKRKTPDSWVPPSPPSVEEEAKGIQILQKFISEGKIDSVVSSREFYFLGTDSLGWQIKATNPFKNEIVLASSIQLAEFLRVTSNLNLPEEMDKLKELGTPSETDINLSKQFENLPDSIKENGHIQTRTVLNPRWKKK